MKSRAHRATGEEPRPRYPWRGSVAATHSSTPKPETHPAPSLKLTFGGPSAAIAVGGLVLTEEGRSVAPGAAGAFKRPTPYYSFSPTGSENEDAARLLAENAALRAEVERLRRLIEPWEFPGMTVAWREGFGRADTQGTAGEP